MSIEVIKQMVAALEYHTAQTRPITQTQEAIAAGKATIEQAGKQEPFGYFQYAIHFDAWVQNRDSNTGVAFYTTPPASPVQEPPPECETEAEKRAYAFGWWKAMEHMKQNP